jgi:HEAT repeat protein
MSISNSIPFTILIDALLDESKPFSPKYLNRFSDLEPADKVLLNNSWSKVSLRRREALLEDLEEVHLADDLLCFEDVGRLALKDSQAGVRRRAVQILREYELVDLLPTFVEMAEHDPDADVRATSTAALASFIYMGEVEDISPKKLLKVEECLLRIISGTDASLVRQKALEALGFSSRKEVIGLIENAYASSDTDWQVAALFAMGRSANSRWKPDVLKMLTHEQAHVRAEAASAAGELEIKSAVPQLLRMLRDSDIDVRMASIWSLSQIGGSGVRTALEALLETTDDDEEANQVEKALENLDFTEEMNNLSLLEIPEDGDDPDGIADDDEADVDDFDVEDDED